MGLFGLFYGLLVAEAGIKETISDSISCDEDLQRAINDGNETFYDRKGTLHYVTKRQRKNGEYVYSSIKVVETVRNGDYNIPHKVLISVDRKDVIKDYTREKIYKFFLNINSIISETNKDETKTYYFIPIDSELRRELGERNFNKYYKRYCGLFERNNNETGRRYFVEHYYNRENREHKYYKYYYNDKNLIDLNSKVQITKEEYDNLGGNEKGYIPDMFFDVV